MHYLKPDPSPKWMSSCVGLVYFQTLVGLSTTTASGLSYEIGVNSEKKVKWNWNIIIKNGHSTFHTSKLRNFNSLGLREVIWIILRHLLWNWLKMRVSAKKNCHSY